jgi:flagellar export protein FliJ
MAFRFRLEKVLKHRQRLVDQQAQDLAKANRVVTEITARIDELSLEIRRCESNTPHAEPSLSTSDRINLSQWILHLRGRRAAMNSDRAAAQQEAEAQRKLMTTAWRDLEVLKKLKVRQKEMWVEEIQKRENQEMDEIGVQRADRTRREKLATT